MKILYESSILGDSYLAARSKAGIYRVITSILNANVVAEDVEMYFCAHKTLIHTVLARKYFLDNSPENVGNFLSTWRLYTFFLDLCELAVSTVHFNTSRENINKLKRKLLVWFLRLVSLTIKKKTIKGIDIYHSFFYALPDVEFIDSKARFITVYDMIPILMPHLFGQGMEGHFKKIISSINIESDWVICISESTKRDFCEYTSMRDDRVFVVPLAASESFFPVSDASTIKTVKEKYDIPEGEYILALSTLEPRKNTLSVIRSFKKLIESNPSEKLYLVLAGAKGWKYEEIFSSVLQYPHLRERIVFAGRIADEDLSTLYSGALFFVYPSLYEGFGLPPLESMACGTPVITSNNSSLPEVVGNAGIMVDVKEPNSLTEAMIVLYKDIDLREKLAKHSLAQAATFSWEKCAQMSLDAYRQALTTEPR